MFIAVLFLLARLWKQLTCSSTGELVASTFFVMVAIHPHCETLLGSKKKKLNIHGNLEDLKRIRLSFFF